MKNCPYFELLTPRYFTRHHATLTKTIDARLCVDKTMTYNHPDETSTHWSTSRRMKKWSLAALGLFVLLYAVVVVFYAHLSKEIGLRCTFDNSIQTLYPAYLFSPAERHPAR